MDSPYENAFISRGAAYKVITVLANMKRSDKAQMMTVDSVILCRLARILKDSDLKLDKTLLFQSRQQQ